MSLSEEQLRALDSCPGLKALKPWFIAMDELIGSQGETEPTGTEPQGETEPTGTEPQGETEPTDPEENPNAEGN